MPDAFEVVGAKRFEAVLTSIETERVGNLFAEAGVPGDRLGAERLEPVVDLIGNDGAIGRVAVNLFGARCYAVRALLLDKSDAANWALGWHQDRTIAVTKQIEAPGFGPWSVKRGQLHVQPPQCVIEAMITLRIHIDRVDEQNAPLRVIAGSHRLGRLSDSAVADAVANGQERICLAEPGDVWAYRTPILHASAASNSTRRRVLQLDYATAALPAGLEWAMHLS